MKKYISLQLVILLAVLTMPATINAASISDISNHKNETAINYLLDNNIVTSYIEVKHFLMEGSLSI